MSKIVGSLVNDIGTASGLWDALSIESAHNYVWSQVWTPEEQLKVVEQLFPSREMAFRYSYDSPVIKRLKAGGLVRELNKNIESLVKDRNNMKLYVYSAHDTTLTALMMALDIFNGKIPPYGATLLIELHEKWNSAQNNTNEYFVRAFYHNETVINTGIPHSIQWTNCQNLVDCPLNQYLTSTQHLLYDNFDQECNSSRVVIAFQFNLFLMFFIFQIFF